MTSLQREVLDVIEMCRAALAIPKRLRPKVSSAVIASADETLQKVKQRRPHDTELSEISIEAASQSWWALRFAMETMIRALLQKQRKEDWRTLR
jgi:hypothetical protein